MVTDQVLSSTGQPYLKPILAGALFLILSVVVITKKALSPGYPSLKQFLTLQAPDQAHYQQQILKYQPRPATTEHVWVPNNNDPNPVSYKALTTRINLWITLLLEILLISAGLWLGFILA